MAHIAVLPSAVADQIAAGEVVERPASVVKELVENALDAGATAVEIVAEDGGRARIRVADDGVGMSRDDALLALERYATSKIRDAMDLVGVQSFGFRGEALPAIASVASLEVETAPTDGAGTAIHARAGATLEVRQIARRRGTTVTVSQLFFNAPNRRDFLRSARSEWRAILDTVTLLALTRRDVRVVLAHEAKRVLTLPPATSLRARIAALWGGRFAERMVEVEDVHGTVQVAGLVERPSDVGTAGRRIFLSVNGRAIQDAGLVRAAERAYRSTIPAGVRPTLLLDLVVPAGEVDVNVHPTKAEIRFRDRWAIERAVEHAVRRALGDTASAPSIGMSGWSHALGAAVATTVDIEVLRSDPVGANAPLLVPSGAAPESREAVAEPAESVPALTQFHRTYLLSERDDGLVLIDQHSAHERVLYERFMRVLERGGAPSQRLLFPITLHLGPAEGDAFEEHRDLFERLGFEIEGFGGHTLIVSSVPMPHPRFDAPQCLRETLDALTGNRHAGIAARHERLAATLACKAAIKAGDALSPEEMRALYLALSRTTLPAHDVHGRSTIVHLAWDEIERRFGRR
ncbi:MAG TPA: DNA mismatch repair endonuclease MutL [Gemmatimonadaceae bacterium]|nr:DNA mismatch repair endonuclease MutL [Gemmatimonadaceae bacterium]